MDLRIWHSIYNNAGIYTSYTGRHSIYDSVILETTVGTDWSEDNNRYYENFIHLMYRRPDKS
jgi:hypothetical protein